MKDLKIFLVLISFSIFFFSCEEVENVQYDGQDFVQLTTETTSVSENSGSFLVGISLGVGQNPDGVTVNFTVNSDDPSRYEVLPNTGSLTIPAGEFTAEIQIDILDNLISDGDIDISIELLGTSGLPIGIGGEDNFAESMVLTILDDDCPLDSQAFVGTFLVQEVFTSGTNEGLTLAGAFGEVYLIQLAIQPGDDTETNFVVTNAPGANVYLNDGTILTFFPCSGEIALSDNQVALFAPITVEETSFDENGSSLRIAGPLGNFGPYEFIFTRI